MPRKPLSAALLERHGEQAHQQLKEELGLDHFEGDPGKVFIVTRWSLQGAIHDSSWHSIRIERSCPDIS
jgi:hypothetical protein